jgi:hypothetical protein
VPLADNLALGIALLSCNGKLCWGLNADYDLVPDLQGIVEALKESFEDLKRAAPGPTLVTSAEPTEPPEPGQARRGGRPRHERVSNVP